MVVASCSTAQRLVAVRTCVVSGKGEEDEKFREDNVAYSDTP
jgi:hypothetical protein